MLRTEESEELKYSVSLAVLKFAAKAAVRASDAQLDRVVVITERGMCVQSESMIVRLA